MEKSLISITSIILIICLFASCGRERIVDVVSTAETVLINGEEVDTVEASMGAFQGKQGDYIEFRFEEKQTFNTVFITEKTATIRQFNIYAEVDGKYKLIHTGKVILNENISFEAVTATALKLEIVNTQIGNDSFTIQDVSAYNIIEEN